jgi:hypothetical protein
MYTQGQFCVLDRILFQLYFHVKQVHHLVAQYTTSAHSVADSSSHGSSDATRTFYPACESRHFSFVLSFHGLVAYPSYSFWFGPCDREGAYRVCSLMFQRLRSHRETTSIVLLD